MLRITSYLSLLIVFISACTSTGITYTRVPDEEKGLLSASFDMTKLNEEPKGYGLYTYVIFGSKLEEHKDSAPDIASTRLESLLEAIDLTILPRDALDKAKIPNSEINLFCIPVKIAKKLANLENYNSDLALLYRDIAIGTLKNEVTFQNKFSTSVGPFLVSTLQPLNQVRTPQPVLFADLSSTNPSAMKELVAAYKQKSSSGVSANDPQKFEPLKLRILSLILDADKNIKLMKSAVAAWTPSQ
ncbi:hypothetical protein [Methyloglobulus sp.]|uniref:hypothetical protein n=1 Tax=Methyloglobulus sp. TaxID=2518622 RepID=UPI003989FA62